MQEWYHTFVRGGYRCTSVGRISSQSRGGDSSSSKAASNSSNRDNRDNAPRQLFLQLPALPPPSRQ